MDIQKLKYFKELCKCKNITAAAKNLYISQQGLSMAIIRLETQLGCKLFDRTSKGLKLTEDGEFLLKHANIILDEYEECEKHFKRTAEKPVQFTLAVSSGTLVEFAAGGLKQFHKEHPEYHVKVEEFVDCICDKKIENQEMEIGLGIEPLDRTKFDTVNLYSVLSAIVVSKDNPLAKYESIPASALDNVDMVTVDDHFKTAEHFLNEIHKEGIYPNVKYRVGDILAVHILAGNGVGAGLGNVSISKVLKTPGTVTVPLENPEFSWSVAIFKLKGKKLSNGAQALWDFMISQAEAKEYVGIPNTYPYKTQDDDKKEDK